MLKKILFSLCCIQLGLFFPAKADSKTPTIPTCIQSISKDAKFYEELKKILKNNQISQEAISKNQEKIYNLVAEQVLGYCLGDINTFTDEIAEQPTIRIPFEMRDASNTPVYYAFEAPTEKLFDYINIPTGILISPVKNKKKGDVITLSEMPKDYFWSDSCSDHWVKFNISDDAPVNVAGRTVFKDFSGIEFFIDFPKGKGVRAFPGLIIGAATGVGGKEQIVWFKNYLTARKAAEDFALNLKKTICKQDNLEVYLVSLATQKISDGDSNRGYAIAAGVSGGAMGAIAIKSISMGPVGWIVGAAIAIGAGIKVLWVETLANIQQVMVLDGPHKI